MVIKNRFGRVCWWNQLASIVIYLFFQISCAEPPGVGLFRETSCSQTEAVKQLRQYLSNRNPAIPTSEPKSEAKSLVILTDLINEKNEKRESRFQYKFVITPVENSNKTNENANNSTEGAKNSSLSFSLEKTEAKGVRERQWFAEEASTSLSKQQLWQEINSVCPSK